MPKAYKQLDLNNRLIWNFRDIGHTLRHISEGKGSQQRILIVLNENGPITQSELTQRLGVQPGSASEVIIKLESAGLIRRLPSDKDKRTTDVHLTKEGRAEALRLTGIRAQRHEQMFATLSDAERTELLRLLEKLNEDWDVQFRQDGEDPRSRRCGEYDRRGTGEK